VAVGLLVLPVVGVAATDGTSLRFLRRAAGIAWGLARWPYPGSPHMLAIFRLGSLFVWVTVAALAVALIVGRLTRRLPRRLFAVLAIGLVVGDLFQAGMGYNPAIPESHATQPVTAAIGYLEHQGTARYVAVTPYDTPNPLPPDVNLRYGIYDLRGYDLPVVTRFADLWTRYVAPATPLLPEDTPSVPLTIENSLLPSTVRVLSLYGVADILEEAHEPPPDIPGLTVAYEGSDATVYKNPSALPRTWLVDGEAVVEGTRAQLARVGAAGFDPRRMVLTPRPLPGLSATPAARSPGTATITHYGAEQVTITARATRRAELVLSDTYYPGWQATVNGRPEPIARVDYLLRGVSVPAGTDRIVFTYDPASFRHGWMVSAGSAVVLVLAVGATVVLGRRRRRPAAGRHVRTGRGRARGTAAVPGPGALPADP
jgi:hypothetical protein